MNKLLIVSVLTAAIVFLFFMWDKVKNQAVMTFKLMGVIIGFLAILYFFIKWLRDKSLEGYNW